MFTNSQKILFFSLILTFAFSAKLFAEGVPLMIPYSGSVSVNGEAFDGAGEFKFAIVSKGCTDESDSTICKTFWSNDGLSDAGAEPTSPIKLPVSAGRFSIKLGNAGLTDMATIPPAVFDNDQVFLRVWFNDGATGFEQLSNDRQLVSVPFSYVSQKALSVEAGSVGLAQINKEEVQARVKACASGSSIREIDSAGNVTCEQDNGNEYTAGDGIVITGGKIEALESDPTVLDSVKDGVSWSELSGVPAGFLDGADNIGILSEADPTVPNDIKDGISWDEVSAKPAGFADGVDNGLISVKSADIEDGEIVDADISTNAKIDGSKISGKVPDSNKLGGLTSGAFVQNEIFLSKGAELLSVTSDSIKVVSAISKSEHLFCVLSRFTVSHGSSVKNIDCSIAPYKGGFWQVSAVAGTGSLLTCNAICF